MDSSRSHRKADIITPYVLDRLLDPTLLPTENRRLDYLYGPFHSVSPLPPSVSPYNPHYFTTSPLGTVALFKACGGSEVGESSFSRAHGSLLPQRSGAAPRHCGGSRRVSLPIRGSSSWEGKTRRLFCGPLLFNPIRMCARAENFVCGPLIKVLTEPSA